MTTNFEDNTMIDRLFKLPKATHNFEVSLALTEGLRNSDSYEVLEISYTHQGMLIRLLDKKHNQEYEVNLKCTKE